MIKITILHNELKKFIMERDSGFSLLIEAYGKKILFDTSFANDIYINAKKCKANLNNIDYLALSHGHKDHTDGLRYINWKQINKLIAHPVCFKPKYYKDRGNIGCTTKLSDIKTKANVILTKKPYWLLKNKILFLGEIPRTNNFESQPHGYLANGKPDYIRDDSAIVIKTTKGLVIISGCSHAGICNIIEYAKKITNEEKIISVIGGFHLFNKKITNQTIKYFKSQNIESIYPGHCLNEYAFSDFKKIKAKRIKTFQKIIYKI